VLRSAGCRRAGALVAALAAEPDRREAVGAHSAGHSAKATWPVPELADGRLEGDAHKVGTWGRPAGCPGPQPAALAPSRLPWRRAGCPGP
jgi:hypothetical protein